MKKRKAPQGVENQGHVTTKTLISLFVLNVYKCLSKPLNAIHTKGKVVL